MRRLLKIEEFIKQISEKEKWNLPQIEIWEVKEKYFKGIYLQCREKLPPEGIKAFPSIFGKKIFIKEGYINRTTVLHEIWHFIQVESGKIGELKNNLKINDEKNLIMATEIQAEGFAQRLARKYKNKWENKMSIK